MATQTIDLAYAATLEPKLAVDYFRAKGFQISHNWQEIVANTHARMFTVAKAARIDILESIYGEVDRALSTGITERQFIDSLTPTLQKLGWWGKQILVDGNGNAEKVQLGSPQRLATIYRTNLATAYQTGRYQQQLATTDTHPYWQYIAIIDENTRPAHAALHGRVFRCDDSIWQKLYPPNGWGCRCRVRALTEAQVKALGLKVESSTGHLKTYEVESGVDKRTGEVYYSEVTTYTNGRAKMRTDAGWSNNVGHAALGSDIHIARKLIELKNRELRQQVIQSLNNAPARQSAFNQWVGNVLTTRRAGHSIQPLGFMTDEIAHAIEQRTGIPPARLFAVSEKNILHADSLKHKNKGVALTLMDYQKLPQMVAKPQAIIWDKQNNNLLYIGAGRDDKIKIVVNAPYHIRKQVDALDVVINTYKTPLFEIQRTIEGGGYELLFGSL